MARRNCWVCGNSYDGWECPVCSRNRLEQESARQAAEQHQEHMEALEEAAQQRADEAARLEELMGRQREATEEAAFEAQMAAEEALEDHRRTTANAWKLQSEAKSGRAYTLFRSRMFEEARKLALQSIEQDPSNFDGFWVVASALVSLGKAKDARVYVEKLIQLLNLPDYWSSAAHFIRVLDLLSTEKDWFLLGSAFSSTLQANARYFTGDAVDLVKELTKLGMLRDAKWLLQSILARGHSEDALDAAFELTKRFVSERNTAAAMDIVDPLLRNSAHVASVVESALALVRQFHALGDITNVQRVVDGLSMKPNRLLTEAFLLEMDSCLGKSDTTRIDNFLQGSGIESRRKLEADMALIKQSCGGPRLSESTVETVTQSLRSKYKSWNELIERQLADAARAHTSCMEVKTHGGWAGVVSFVGLMLAAIAFCFSLGFPPESTGPYFAFGTLFGAILVGTLFGTFEKQLRVSRERNRVLASSFDSENRRFTDLGLPTLSPRSMEVDENTGRFVAYAIIAATYVVCWFALMAGNHGGAPARATNSPATAVTARGKVSGGNGKVAASPSADRGNRYEPEIHSVHWIAGETNHKVVISGSGFGALARFDGDSPYIIVTDVTRNWNAGHHGDLVTVDITEWTDDRITVSSFGSAYGRGWAFETGDIVRIQVWNPETNKGPASATTTVSSVEGTQPRGANEPTIASVSKIYPRAIQRITIAGSGFGNQVPYDGDSAYIVVTDMTQNWNAGNPGDLVTLKVATWTENEIVVEGFTGYYGAQWSLAEGDSVRIQVWNAQTQNGPATISATVSKP